MSSPPPTRPEVLATLAIIGGLLGVLGARAILRRLGPHPSPDQCAAMLERYAEHQARAADLSERPSRHAAPDGGQKASPAEVARCARELTSGEFDCAMRANNADELERCLP
jgi:hypothetical protein